MVWQIQPEWCISRQLWWGHRIPAYRLTRLHSQISEICGDAALQYDDDDDEDKWFVGRSAQEAGEQAAAHLAAAGLRGNPNIQHTGDALKALEQVGFTLTQDEDVLDTWFSSGIFPLSALGWPHADSSEDELAFLGKRYPLDVLETGGDILFFWVARMAMLCPTILNSTKAGKFPGDANQIVQPPFRKIWLHPLVRDKSGRKMSKSLGNVIDPLHLIRGATVDELAAGASQGGPHAEASVREQYPSGLQSSGADALRLALLGYLQQGRAINLDAARVASNRCAVDAVAYPLYRYFLRIHGGLRKNHSSQSIVVIDCVLRGVVTVHFATSCGRPLGLRCDINDNSRDPNPRRTPAVGFWSTTHFQRAHLLGSDGFFLDLQ
eukprot:SAG31_NODE_276_length_18650_cov_5.821842_21_plen_379_part_00